MGLVVLVRCIRRSALQHAGAFFVCQHSYGYDDDDEAGECRDCLEVHARAQMRVDADTVQEMLMDTLPSVFKGRLDKPEGEWEGAYVVG